MNNEMLTRRAICTLPVELQHKILETVKAPPPAPRKPLSRRLQGFINRWNDTEHNNRLNSTRRTLF